MIKAVVAAVSRQLTKVHLWSKASISFPVATNLSKQFRESRPRRLFQSLSLFWPPRSPTLFRRPTSASLPKMTSTKFRTRWTREPHVSSLTCPWRWQCFWPPCQLGAAPFCWKKRSCSTLIKVYLGSLPKPYFVENILIEEILQQGFPSEMQNLKYGRYLTMEL